MRTNAAGVTAGVREDFGYIDAIVIYLGFFKNIHACCFLNSDCFADSKNKWKREDQTIFAYLPFS